MNSDQSKVQIFVALLDEGSECFVPVDAIPEGNAIFRIVSKNELDPETENWEFNCGDRVKVEQRLLSHSQNGTLTKTDVLVAVSIAE